MDEFWANAVWSVVPTVFIGLLFWFLIRVILRADRNERSAYAKIEAEERAFRVKNSDSNSTGQNV